MLSLISSLSSSCIIYSPSKWGSGQRDTACRELCVLPADTLKGPETCSDHPEPGSVPHSWSRTWVLMQLQQKPPGGESKHLWRFQESSIKYWLALADHRGALLIRWFCTALLQLFHLATTPLLRQQDFWRGSFLDLSIRFSVLICSCRASVCCMRWSLCYWRCPLKFLSVRLWVKLELMNVFKHFKCFQLILLKNTGDAERGMRADCFCFVGPHFIFMLEHRSFNRWFINICCWFVCNKDGWERAAACVCRGETKQLQNITSFCKHWVIEQKQKCI